MRFKVVPHRDGEQRDDAMLQGIANGYGELYPVPEHPGCIKQHLDKMTVPEQDLQERALVESERLPRGKLRRVSRG